MQIIKRLSQWDLFEATSETRMIVLSLRPSDVLHAIIVGGRHMIRACLLEVILKYKTVYARL